MLDRWRSCRWERVWALSRVKVVVTGVRFGARWREAGRSQNIKTMKTRSYEDTGLQEKEKEKREVSYDYSKMVMLI